MEAVRMVRDMEPQCYRPRPLLTPDAADALYYGATVEAVAHSSEGLLSDGGSAIGAAAAEERSVRCM